MLRALIFCLSMMMTFSVYASGSYVEYKMGGISYEGYYISPSSNAPLIMMVHDWDGLTDYEVKRANMLAELGYAVFAVDLFGKDVRPKTTKEKVKLTGALYGNRDKMRSILKAAISKAQDQGGNISNAVTIGYCFGGAVALELARSGVDMKGFVTFHGGLKTPKGQDYSKAKGKMLILHGSADTSVTMDHFSALAKEFESNKISHEMISYSGAPHAFTVFGSSRYRADADEKSWNRFLDYLKEVVN